MEIDERSGSNEIISCCVDLGPWKSKQFVWALLLCMGVLCLLASSWQRWWCFLKLVLLFGIFLFSFFSLPFLPYCSPCFNLCNGGKKGNLCSRLHDDKTFPYCPQVTNWLYLQNIKGYRYALRRGVTPAISGCISTKLGDSKERFLACLDCVLLIYFKYIGYILVYFGGPKGLQLQFWCWIRAFHILPQSCLICVLQVWLHCSILCVEDSVRSTRFQSNTVIILMQHYNTLI